jgi:hypothetical protein
VVQVLLAIEDRIPGVSVNVPPEWTGVPNPPVFFEGSPGETYSLLPFVFDADGDALSFLDTGTGFSNLSFDEIDFDPNAFDFSEGLPEGVTISGSDLIIDASAPSSNTNIQIYVTDGINTPVLSGVFNLVITPLDIPPVFNSTPPNPIFTGGTSSTYDFNNDITDDAVSSITWSISGSLGPGLSFNTTTGVLSYDGTGASSTNSHTVTAIDAIGQDTSVSFNIVVTSTTTGTDTPDYVDPVDGVVLDSGRTIVAATPANLQSKLDAAAAGETIELGAGNYTAQYTIDKSAPATDPIIIKGASNFTSICSNKWTIDGARIIVTGILFSGASVNLNLYGNNNKIIGNKFTGWGSLTVGSRYAISARLSTFAEIAYNEIYEPGPFHQNSYLNHPTYGGDGSVNNSLRIGIRTSEGSTGVNMPTDTWVHHNLFRDFPDKPRPANYSSGQDDALEWGETVRNFTPAFDTGLYFEYNMILRHLQGGSVGAGTVDLKTGGGAVARYNTFIDSPGRLDQRGPTVLGVTFESNHFDNVSGGMNFHGCNNRIIGNVCEGGGIGLVAGAVACDENPQTVLVVYHFEMKLIQQIIEINKQLLIIH